MGEALKEEGHRFLSFTSLKGVPRVVSSETWCLRIFWLAAVLGLFSFAFYMVYTLIISYLEFAVVTSFYERSVHPDGYVVKLPFITLCSQSPLPYSQPYPPNVTTLEDYYVLVDQRLQCGANCSQEQQDLYRNAREELKSPAGYFQYLGVPTAQLLGHQKDQLIVNCQVIVLAGTQVYRISCDDIKVNFEKRVLKDFFNCFDVSAGYNIQPEYGVVLGIELVLYLDTGPVLGGPGRGLRQGPETMKSGALVLLSEHGASDAYMIQIEGSDVPAGNDVRINVHPKIRERQKAPYGNCVNYTEGSVNSQASCFGQCFDQHVQDQCGCTDPSTPLNIQDSHPLPFCLKLQPNISAVAARVQCRDRAMKELLGACLEQCPLACSEQQYDLRIQTSSWPDPSHLREFHDQILHHHPSLPSVPDLEDVLDGNCTDDMECELKLSRATRYIRANFARLSCHLTDHKVFLLKDVKKINVSELFSQLGGTLNLWSGITVVVILEVGELLYRLICRMFRTDMGTKVKVTPNGETVNDARLPVENGQCVNCRRHVYVL